MAKTVETIDLLQPSPGTRRSLKVHRYGRPGAAPKAYLQAALHSDEYPGLMALHHLIGLLDAADARGEIAGHIVVVPVANPIGLGQRLNGYHVGRFEFDGGGNFNRGWPEFSSAVADAVEGRLGDDAEANVAMIRKSLCEQVGKMAVKTEFDGLRKVLLGLSIDADIVLDLHCDLEALVHLYSSARHQGAVAELGADLGAEVVLLEEEPGGQPFDEANAALWWKLRRRLGDGAPDFPDACFSATVELRGQGDIEDRLGQDDARGLFRFLQRRGVVGGDPGPLPEALCRPTPLEATDVLAAPHAGLVAYRKALGARVKKGEAVADLIDLMADDPAQARTPIVSRADGIMFSRLGFKLVRPGDTVAKVAGAEKLAHRMNGNLLEP